MLWCKAGSTSELLSPCETGSNLLLVHKRALMKNEEVKPCCFKQVKPCYLVHGCIRERSERACIVKLGCKDLVTRWKPLLHTVLAALDKPQLLQGSKSCSVAGLPVYPTVTLETLTLPPISSSTSTNQPPAARNATVQHTASLSC